MKPAPFTSDFMLLDVKNGRAKLAKEIKAGGMVTVWIKATIEGAGGVGRDDGASIEFAAEVISVKVASGK